MSATPHPHGSILDLIGDDFASRERDDQIPKEGHRVPPGECGDRRTCEVFREREPGAEKRMPQFLLHGWVLQHRHHEQLESEQNNECELRSLPDE